METFENILQKYTRLIEKMANSYGVNDQEIVKDLEACGNIALWSAYTRFDSTKNVPFLGYAKTYIRGYMLKYLRDHLKTIRLSASAQLDKSFISTTNTLSFNTPIGENSILEDVLTSGEGICPYEEEDATRASLAILNQLLDTLKPKDQDIIRMRYGILPYTQVYLIQEIADKYGYSRQNIDLILNKALKQMKDVTKRK